MSLFINPKRTKRFVLPEEKDLDPSKQHVFILKTMTAREYADRHDRSRDHTEGDLVARVNVGAWQRWTLFFGLVGAEGASYPLPFSIDPNTEHVSEAFIDTLSPETRGLIAREIERLSKLAHDDPKD